jgi:hypothetical protein
MIIYSVNVTLKVQDQTEWLEWMMTKHIKDILDTGHFVDCKVRQQVEPEPEEDYITFNIQYECKSLEDYRTYKENDAPRLRDEHIAKFGGKFTAHRQVLIPFKNPFGDVVS